MAAGELDVARFEALLGAARAAARDSSWDTAAAEARAALALWRGEPLADVDSELLAAREVPRLAELRLQALETRIDADLHLGRHAEVIAELRRLAAAHPLREHLHAPADARPVPRRPAGRGAGRLPGAPAGVLVDELGAEPGPGCGSCTSRSWPATRPWPLRPAGTARTGGRSPSAAGAAAAAGRRCRHFTGRAGELAALTGLLDQAGEQAPGTVVISAIGGTAGVGKTALARALGAPGRRAVPGRAAVCEPARL